MNFFMNIVVFWLLATRLTGFLALAPGIQDMQVPKLVRVAVIVWLSCFMTPMVTAPPAISLDWVSLAGALSLEFLCGLGLGLVTRLVITALQAGGALIDNDLGLSAAQQLSPTAGISGGVMGRILMIVGLAYFLGIGLSLGPDHRRPAIVSRAAARLGRRDAGVARSDGAAKRGNFRGGADHRSADRRALFYRDDGAGFSFPLGAAT